LSTHDGGHTVDCRCPHVRGNWGGCGVHTICGRCACSRRDIDSSRSSVGWFGCAYSGCGNIRFGPVWASNWRLISVFAVYYTVSLGPIDAGLLAGDVWVDVDVDGVSLGGRAPLGSVPQAAFAQVAATADAVSGVAVDVSDCSDGDVFTYRSATSTMVCEPTPDTGVVVGVTTHVTSGRRVLPITNSIQMESFTVDKKSSTSILMVQGTISGFGNYSGSMQQGWRFGSNPEVLAQSTMYDNTSHSRIFSTSVVMSGIGQVGPQNLVFRYFSQNGSASDRPFVTYNPTSADDARIGSTQSVYVVWEIEP
jgi:hypothetical protein